MSESTEGVTRSRSTLRDHGGAVARAHGRYLIAADGAASETRRQLGLELTDYGFDEPWVIVDAEVPDPGMGPDYTIMYCDPARPATYVPGPGHHRRWEFMLLPGETGAQFDADDAVGELIRPIAPWLGEELTVLRKAVYRFHALVARTWRDGRVFLAGDAAHQTPPFYGQGMCHGVRDVRNLLWKIAAIRDGRADDALLDTYQSEREPHVRAIIEAAVANGRYICTLDPQEAAERDRQLRERMGQGQDVRSFREVIPGLSAGSGLVGTEDASGAVGLLFVQPRVRVETGASALLDDVLGDRFALISSVAAPPGTELDRFTEILEAVVLELGVTLIDDGTLAAWFDAFGVVAALVRPDRYVFGVAHEQTDIPGLLSSLLTATVGPAALVETPQ